MRLVTLSLLCLSVKSAGMEGIQILGHYTVTKSDYSKGLSNALWSVN
jgi:hypothetical protein